MIVRMWEATVVPGRYDDAVEWVRRDLVKRALFTAGCMAAEILVHEGTPESVVLLTRWDVAPVFEERFRAAFPDHWKKVEGALQDSRQMTID